MPLPSRPQRAVAVLAGVTFAGIVAANSLGYVFYALVSRVVGVEAYGTFSSLVAIVLMLSAPAVIAQMVVAKLATGYHADPEGLAGLVHVVERVAFGAGAFAGASVAAASFPIAAFLHIADPLLVTLAALSLCGAVSLPFLRGVLQGTSAFGAFSLSAVAENLAKALLAPGLAAILGLRGALGGTAAAYATAVAYTYVSLQRHRRKLPAKFGLRDVLATSGPVALAILCVNMMLFFDVVLAKRYLDPHAAGLYGAAALAGRALFSVIAFVPTVLLPQAAIRAGRGERTRFLFIQAIGVSVGICGAAVALFALRPTFVITAIAGTAFAEAAPFVLLYGLGISALAIANVVATYNIARGAMGFARPLLAVAILEVASVVLRHDTPYDLLQTIAVGHSLGLVACCTALSRRRTAVSPAGLTKPSAD